MYIFLNSAGSGRVAQVPGEVIQPQKMGGPGALHLGTWESTELVRPVLLFLDICFDFVVSYPSMPSGLIRYEHTGSFHFLTFSCYHRRPHLASPEAKNLFEDALERIRKKYKFVVAGYVVMPEHVHLLIGEPVKGGGWPALNLVTNAGCPILESFFDSRVGDHEPR
jgi:hypothetical protein